MKKTTFTETEATYEDKLAMIMAVGDATTDEASRALEECGGNIDRALALVYDQAPPPSSDYASFSSSLHNAPYKPSRKARHSEDVDDESIAKPRESLRHAPTLVARRQPFVAAAASPKGPKENVFHVPHQPTTIYPSVASANQNAGTINQTTTNAVTAQDSLLHAPGAFAVYGPSDVVGGHDDDNFTYTQLNVSVVDNAQTTNPTNPVEAHLIDNSDDIENLQEQLQQEREALRRREEELERIQRHQENIVVGQVLGVGNNDDDEEKAAGIHSNNEDPSSSCNNKSMCASKRKVTIAAVVLLVIVAVVVGILVAMFSKSAERTPTTMADWINSCDESSSSLAKQLPCVSQDETALSLRNNSLTGTIPSEVGLLSKLNVLSLSSNSLTGTIPTEIALMSNLSWLSLFNNSLTGTIPSQTALMSNLSWLHLYSNSLMGTIPSEVGLLSNLTSLVLLGNSLTGMIPSEAGLLSNLNVLSLSSNSLTGTIPTEIALMSNLFTLLLYNNNFMGEFTCPAFIDECWISCAYDIYTHTEACRSL
jgi:hypothetical protein